MTVNNRKWLSPLLRWINGEANRHDERSLDDLAKDDPFLAEALEGYRTLPESEEHAAAVTRLKANLRTRVGKRRGTSFYLLRVAAIGALLLLGWVAVDRFLVDESASVEVAYIPTEMKEASPAASQAVVADSVSGMERSAPTVVTTEGPVSLENKPGSTPPSKSNANQPPVSSPRIEPLADAIAADDQPVAAESIPATLDMDVLAEKPAVPKEEEKAKKSDNARAEAAQKKSAPSPLPPANSQQPARRVAGIVTDETGQPLFGVKVYAGNEGTTTDLDGKYAIDLSPGASSLSFAYVGYATLEVRLNEDNRLDVELSDSGVELSEVVVSKKGSGKVIAPKPKIGDKRFEKYIRENLRYPAAAAKAGIKGQVVLRFWVAEDGTLSDFKVLQPLGYGCDEEAIRLLRQGPKWKTQPGAFASYAVRFD